MDEPEPKEVTGRAPMSRTITIRSNKVVIGHEEGVAPDLEPMFVNNVEVMNVGGDFYLDVGVVKPEDIIKAGLAPDLPVDEQAFLNFYVLQRIAMSKRTFSRLIESGNEILTKIKAEGKEEE